MVMNYAIEKGAKWNYSPLIVKKPETIKEWDQYIQVTTVFIKLQNNNNLVKYKLN